MNTGTFDSSTKMSADRINDPMPAGDSEYRGMQERFRKMEKKIATLRQDNDVLRRKTELQEVRTKELMDTLDIMGKDVEEPKFCSTKREEMVEEIEKLKYSEAIHQKVQDRQRNLLKVRGARIVELETANARMKSNESGVSKKKKSQLKQQIRAEDEEKDQAIESLQSEVNNMNELIKALELEKTQDIDDLNIKMTEEAEEANAKEEKMDQEITNLKTEIRRWEESFKTSDAASREVEDMKSKLATEEKQVKELEATKMQEIEALKSKLLQADQRVKEYEAAKTKEIEDLKKHLRNSEECAKICEKTKGVEIKDLKKQVKELEDDSGSKSREIETFKREVQELRDGNQSKLQQVEDLRGQLVEGNNLSHQKPQRSRGSELRCKPWFLASSMKGELHSSRRRRRRQIDKKQKLRDYKHKLMSYKLKLRRCTPGGTGAPNTTTPASTTSGMMPTQTKSLLPNSRPLSPHKKRRLLL